MNGKLYSKRTLGGRWSGPYAHSGTVTAVSGVRGAIYGVGTNRHIYRRSGLRGRWTHIRGSCCVKDISVRDVSGHPVYGKILSNVFHELVNQMHVVFCFLDSCCGAQFSNSFLQIFAIDSRDYRNLNITQPYSNYS